MGDERIPRECVETLYRAAREPKKIIWIESEHLRPTKAELIDRLAQEVTREIFAGSGSTAPANDDDRERSSHR
jgi:hypothetical protein